ncbi:hypothetical protein RB595_004268 [Gaeumannomyces hyphopodioides]
MRPTAYIAAALGLASPICVVATDPLTADKVEADITTTGLQRVLWNLNKIARDNGGNRAFGTPGYKASVDFVLERAQQRFGREMDTHLHPFSYWFEDLRQIRVTGPEGEDVIMLSPMYNVAGDVRATPLIDTPVDDARGSGCLPEQWAGIDATGKLALIKRGTCAVSQKLALAKQHGAVGALVWNNRPGDAIISLTLGAENRDSIVPVGIITQEVGLAWKARLAAGEQVLVSLLVDNSYDVRESWNVISETKEGDPSKVVMIGAHLDSVIQGPGINDDGSGSSAVLEIMGSVKKYKGFPHKIRFAWWGAEESGLIGSQAYTESLNATQADAIRYYFNYDMIGSVNPIYELARNELSGVGPVLLSSYLESKGKPVTYALRQLRRSRHPNRQHLHGRGPLLPPSLRHHRQHRLGCHHNQRQSCGPRTCHPRALAGWGAPAGAAGREAEPGRRLGPVPAGCHKRPTWRCEQAGPSVRGVKEKAQAPVPERPSDRWRAGGAGPWAQLVDQRYLTV